MFIITPVNYPAITCQIPAVKRAYCARMHNARALEVAQVNGMPNAAIVKVINIICAFPAVSGQNVCCEKGLLLFTVTLSWLNRTLN